MVKRNYTPAKGHNYEDITIREATCKQGGLVLTLCKDCGDFHQTTTAVGSHNYKTEKHNATCRMTGYKEPKGHTPTDWIIDIPATIESAGEKHIECSECKAVLSRVAIAQLVGKDNSDEDGKAVIGDYSIILIDENGKPIFNSELTIDVNDNVSIVLTGGRLLDYAKPTTITAFYTETQEPKTDLAINIVDANGNKATGKTDAEGQLVVPNDKTNTGDDNGTIGKDDEDKKQTFVVTVTDKTNVVIPNCDVYIGESNNVVVDLPEGIKPTRENPVIVTITDHDGNPQTDITVIAMGDADFVEKGKTDYNGKITLPTAADGYTDENGKVNVDELNIIVNDELGVIPNAYVKHNEDDSISVTLHDEKTISYANRITVTVLDSIGVAVKDKTVTVTDIAEVTYTDTTDDNGKIVVPPTNIDVTDINGYGELNGYSITVKNETAPIEKAELHIDENNNISVKLPESVKFDYKNRITVIVSNKADGTPAKDMSVTVNETVIDNPETEENESLSAKTLNGKTDKDGVVVFPPLSEDVTDDKGNSDVTDKKDDTETKYNVYVKDTKGDISNALVEIKDGKVYVTLPETHTLTTSNQTTVTVTDKDNKAVQGVSVTIKDKTTEKTGTTNSNGQVTLPVKSSGGGGGGSSSGGSSGGGGGGFVSTNTTNVKVTDKDGKTVNVSKSTDKDGNVTLTLPTGKTLDSNNYYTITTTDRYGKVKADVNVTLKDKKGNSANGKTDKNGTLILPATEHKAYIVGYDDGKFMPDADMSRAEAAAIFARLISEEKNESISGKSTFTDVKSNEWYSKYIGYLEKYNVINGYNDKTFKPDAPVTRAEFVSMAVRYFDIFNDVKKDGYTANYKDLNKNYWAYADIAYAKHIGWLNGYADGTFKGDNNITRAEVVTVVNRATGRKADESYVKDNFTKLNRFTDVTDSGMWYFFDVAESSNDHKAIIGTDGETWVK